VAEGKHGEAFMNNIVVTIFGNLVDHPRRFQTAGAR